MFNNNYPVYGQPYGGCGQNQYIAQPQMQPQPQMYQNVPQPTLQNMQNAQMPMNNGQPVQYENIPIREIKYVTSDEAKAYIVMPNSRSMLIDRQNQIVHIKGAYGSEPSVTKYYKYEEVNADGSPVKPIEKAPEVDFSQFIKVADIPALIGQYGFVTAEQYKSLQDQLNALRAQIKGNNGGANNNGRNKQQTNG